MAHLGSLVTLKEVSDQSNPDVVHGFDIGRYLCVLKVVAPSQPYDM